LDVSEGFLASSGVGRHEPIHQCVEALEGVVGRLR
jgi:hypothetical protein